MTKKGKGDMSEPFYAEYQRLILECKPLPSDVRVSIGSKGSIFFTDSLPSPTKERNGR